MAGNNSGREKKRVQCYGRRSVLKSAGIAGLTATGFAGSVAAGDVDTDDNTCFDCTGSSRDSCEEVDCVTCSDLDNWSDYHGDTDRWRYYEGGTWSDADYRIYEEVNTGLIYYGTFNNCSGQYLHQFRLVGHGRREFDDKNDTQFYDDPDIRHHKFRIWEDSDRSDLTHSIFTSSDGDQLAGCPMPDDETQDTIQDLLDLAYTGASVAVSKANPTIGAVWTACNLGINLIGVLDQPEKSSGEVKKKFDYLLSNRPAEIGHFIDFYVETEEGVNCKINVESEMKGDATTATNIHTEITTPDTESYEGCSSSISTLSAMEKERYNATVIPPSEQHRFNIPTPLRNQTRPIQRLELPVTFTDSSTNETTTGPDKP